MNDFPPGRQFRYPSAAILLAGGPPAETQDLEAVLRIEDGVVSFVRAVLAAGHRVQVIADPTLSLLAAAVAGEYDAMFDRGPLVEVLEIRDPHGPASEQEDRPSVLDGLPGVGRRNTTVHLEGALDREPRPLAFMAIGHGVCARAQRTDANTPPTGSGSRDVAAGDVV